MFRNLVAGHKTDSLLVGIGGLALLALWRAFAFGLPSAGIPRGLTSFVAFGLLFLTVVWIKHLLDLWRKINPSI